MLKSRKQTAHPIPQRPTCTQFDWGLAFIWKEYVYDIEGLIYTFAQRQNSVQDDNQQYVHYKSTGDGE